MEKQKVWSMRAKEWKECHDAPDLQTAELQRHPIADLAGMKLHVIIVYLSWNETDKSPTVDWAITQFCGFIFFILTSWCGHRVHVQWNAWQ